MDVLGYSSLEQSRNEVWSEIVWLRVVKVGWLELGGGRDEKR